MARKTATGTRTLWTAIRKRVETWDCAVYALWVAEHLGLSRKTDAWWDAMAEKLDALPPPAEYDNEANQSPNRAPTQPTRAAPAAPAAPKRVATRATRRRAAPSSYLKGRR
ncbi:hypothetical protein D3C86_1731910 [compost metagenome]